MIIDKNHPVFTYANDVINICSPLKSLGIHYFAYVKSYDDGSRIYLCSSQGAADHHINGKIFLKGPCEAKPSTYKKQVFLWKNQEKQWLYEWVNQHDIGNGIAFVSPQKDYCEFFTYAGSVSNHNLTDVYFSNFEYLQNFSTYFLSRIKEKMVPVLEKNKVILPWNPEPIIKIPAIEELREPTPQLKLSPREYECAKLLLQGKTQKETAKILSLSPRTIEGYIENLKIKMTSKNKSSLIAKLAQSKLF